MKAILQPGRPIAKGSKVGFGSGAAVTATSPDRPLVLPLQASRCTPQWAKSRLLALQQNDREPLARVSPWTKTSTTFSSVAQ
jgi:hypothetical protein